MNSNQGFGNKEPTRLRNLHKLLICCHLKSSNMSCSSSTVKANQQVEGVPLQVEQLQIRRPWSASPPCQCRAGHGGDSFAMCSQGSQCDSMYSILQNTSSFWSPSVESWKKSLPITTAGASAHRLLGSMQRAHLLWGSGRTSFDAFFHCCDRSAWPRICPAQQLKTSTYEVMFKEICWWFTIFAPACTCDRISEGSYAWACLLLQHCLKKVFTPQVGRPFRQDYLDVHPSIHPPNIIWIWFKLLDSPRSTCQYLIWPCCGSFVPWHGPIAIQQVDVYICIIHNHAVHRDLSAHRSDCLEVTHEGWHAVETPTLGQKGYRQK